MPPTSRRFAALAAAPVLLLTIGVGCAQSDPGVFGPEVDPSLPGVGADYDASPANGSKLPEAGSTVEEEDDAGPPDASPPVDAGTDTSVATTPPKPTQGEVLITEVMYDPSGTEPQGEWIELYNTATSARSLTGLVLVDGANRSHSIGVGVTIQPGAYVVLVRDKPTALTAQVPAAAIVYDYGKGLGDAQGVLLANGSNGAVTLKNGAAVVATATYGGWFGGSGGSSVQLKVLTFAASSSSANWCLSSKTWAAGTMNGTPGAGSDCP